MPTCKGKCLKIFLFITLKYSKLSYSTITKISTHSISWAGHGAPLFKLDNIIPLLIYSQENKIIEPENEMQMSIENSLPPCWDL